MRLDSLLARLAVLVPILYFGTVLVAAATWPAYSHVTRYASELGGPEAPHPAIFNVGIIVMGVTCALSAFGLFATAIRAGGRPGFSALGGLCVAFFGVAMVLGGAFPMPNPLHAGFGLGFAQVVAPLAFALAFRGRPGFAGFVGVLVASFALMAATMAVMMGVGHLVTRANVGLWQRANALAMFPWLAVAGAVLAGRADAAAAALSRAAPASRAGARA